MGNLIRCSQCKGQKGRDVVEGDDVRWVICSGCNGVGEIDAAARPEKTPEPPKQEEEDRQPWSERQLKDIWLNDFVEEAIRKVKNRLARGPDAFDSLLIDHQSPIMERLIFQDDLRLDSEDLNAPTRNFRIVLNRISPVGDPKGSTRERLAWKNREVDFHPHDVPSVVYILEGGYEHTVGYKGGPLLTTWQVPGSRYTMIDPRCWHSTAPYAPTYTIMVQGDFYSDAVKETGPQHPALSKLKPAVKLHMWWNYCRILGIAPDEE